MTVVVISQPMLFPWPGMFEQFQLADVWVHYDDVQFPDKSFINRVQRKTAAGTKWLTVPLKKHERGELICDLWPADHIDWRAEHLQAMGEAYRAAPYRAEMLEVMEATYDSQHGRLADLLVDGFHRLAGRLGVDAPATVARSSALGVPGGSSQRILDIVRHFDGTRYVTGHGALRYLDFEAFEREGITVDVMDYSCTPYPQLHGEFTPYVSALDLVAMMGPEGGSRIRPQVASWRDFEPTPRR